MDVSSKLSVTFNARELGGIPTAGGGAVTSQLLFRSDALTSLTDAGVQALADYRIGTVIDLRTDFERAQAADVLPADGSVRLLPLAVQGGAMDQMVSKMIPADTDPASLTPERMQKALDAIPTLEQLYVDILRSGVQVFVTIARTVLNSADSHRPGVLFHCTAGKDRTGLAAAILLLIADADRDAIIADYHLTESNLAGGFAENLTGLITGMGVPLTPNLLTLTTKSPVSAITAAMRWLDDEHGGAHGYLTSGGMTQAEINQLRDTIQSG